MKAVRVKLMIRFEEQFKNFWVTTMINPLGELKRFLVLEHKYQPPGARQEHPENFTIYEEMDGFLDEVKHLTGKIRILKRVFEPPKKTVPKI